MNINDIKFEPKASEEVIERGKQWLVSEKPGFSSTAAFAIMGENGKQSCHPSAPCHGAINSPINFNPAIVATSNRWEKNASKVEEEDAEFFLNWFLNDSHYGRFILNRDDPEFCLHYGFIVSADIYTPLMQNILIITRHFYEVNSARFTDFRKYVQNGGNPYLAFNAFMCSYWSVRGSTTPLSAVVQSYGGHRAHNLFTLAGLNNFISGELGHLVEEEFVNNPEFYYSNKNTDYYGGKTFFLGDGEKRVPAYTSSRPKTFINDMITGFEALRKELATFRGEDGMKTYSPPNPFKVQFSPVVVPNPDEATYEELSKVILPFMKENTTWIKN